MNDDLYRRFEERIADKKANKSKLHNFAAEFRIGILAENEQDADEKVKMLAQNLTVFDDITSADGKLI